MSCRKTSLRRVRRPYEYEISHDGRPPVTIRIPDLEVVACTNPDCRPENPGDTVILDDAAIGRITEATYRQLGLLTPDEVRAGRKKLGLTQQALQELLGLGGNSLSRWENARVYQARSMDTLLRIVFDVPEAAAHLRTRHERADVQPGETRVKFQYLAIDEDKRSIQERRKRSATFDPTSVFADVEEN